MKLLDIELKTTKRFKKHEPREYKLQYYPSQNASLTQANLSTYTIVLYCVLLLGSYKDYVYIPAMEFLIAREKVTTSNFDHLCRRRLGNRSSLTMYLFTT